MPGVRAGKNDSYYRETATRVGKAVSIPVIEVGGNRCLSTMEEILSQGGVSYFSLSRPLICEPDLPARWASGDVEDSKCISCNQCHTVFPRRCVYLERQKQQPLRAKEDQ